VRRRDRSTTFRYTAMNPLFFMQRPQRREGESLSPPADMRVDRKIRIWIVVVFGAAILAAIIAEWLGAFR
jgi:hypothetical protein